MWTLLPSSTVGKGQQKPPNDFSLRAKIGAGIRLREANFNAVCWDLFPNS
jgi:hypothetical protein